MEPDDPEDPHQLPEVTTAPEDIVGKTLLPVSADGYDAAQGVYIENRPGLPLDVAALASAQLELTLPEEGPQVLIMHTHGSEAYTPDGEDVYTPSGECRTTDKTHSVVRVGEEIAQVLTEMGLSVIHDTELYDYPEYNGSYDRSLAAVETYLERYPTIKVVMDVHRDALIGEDGTIYKPITTINSEKCAQVMLVMGSDAKYTHPNWRQNLSLAVKIQKEMNTLWPTLARPIGPTGKPLQSTAHHRLLAGGGGLSRQHPPRGPGCGAYVRPGRGGGAAGAGVSPCAKRPLCSAVLLHRGASLSWGKFTPGPALGPPGCRRYAPCRWKAGWCWA